jgi:uncharacterized cupredoxin-like copper-binding protein
MPRILCRLAVILGLTLAVTGCGPSGGAASYTYAPPAPGAPATAPSSGASGPPSVAPSAAASAAAPSTSAGAASPSAASASASPAGGPSITLTEWQVVAAGTMKSGKSDLTITNAGALPHELLIFKSDRDPKAYPVDAAGDIKEEGAGVALVSDGENIDPDGTQTRSVDLAPGKYMFVCNIPTHFKQGMYEIVIVTK